MAPPCALGLLATWWRGSKGKLLERQWARWKPFHFLWHDLWSCAVLLSLLLFWSGNGACLLREGLVIWKRMWDGKYCCGHFWKVQLPVCERSVVQLPSQNAKFLEGSVGLAMPLISLLLATPEWWKGDSFPFGDRRGNCLPLRLHKMVESFS